MTKTDDKIRAILARPYVRRLLPDPECGYTVTVHEFPGCIAEGDTAEEALANFDRAAESWLAVCLAEGYPVIEPVEASEYVGRIALRIPRGLHRDVAELARLDECAVDQLLAVAISEYVGRRQGLTPGEAAKLHGLAGSPKEDVAIVSK
ncbi:MAG: type II toxin-antitoxin system HicB family antitoxin [Pseudomonadota bacterium]|jgi:predicted RNase H-like HicB family nuclease